jgi:hypothetical protein
MADVQSAVEAMELALDVLAHADATDLADGEAVVLLHRQLARLEAMATRASAAFDASREWEVDGARSAAAWIATRAHVPTEASRKRVRLGRDLRHMAAVDEAWTAGDIAGVHASMLARARSGKRAEAFARDEELLVGHAKGLRFSHFCRALRYWCYRADPDGTEDEADDDYKARRVHVSEGFRGTKILDGVLDPIGGAIFATELERIEQRLFEEDWAEARARLGDKACAADLRRTPRQRRADALVEMARRSAALPEGSRTPEPLFSVFIDLETLYGMICELADGTVVTPGSLVPHLDRAWLERVVFGPDSRVMDLGVRRRLFTGATRRAVQLRDRECFHEFCDLPADKCQVDHIERYADGGETKQDNGRPACGFHNRGRERSP